ncbi:MAG: hypothetical protein ACTSSK_03600 [Candidatus Heimdallarchaeota archaeon]
MYYPCEATGIMNYYCGPLTVGEQTYMMADAAMYYYTLWMDDTPHYLKVYGEGCRLYLLSSRVQCRRITSFVG